MSYTPLKRPIDDCNDESDENKERNDLKEKALLYTHEQSRQNKLLPTFCYLLIEPKQINYESDEYEIHIFNNEESARKVIDNIKEIMHKGFDDKYPKHNCCNDDRSDHHDYISCVTRHFNFTINELTSPYLNVILKTYQESGIDKGIIDLYGVICRECSRKWSVDEKTLTSEIFEEEKSAQNQATENNIECHDLPSRGFENCKFAKSGCIINDKETHYQMEMDGGYTCKVVYYHFD